MQIASFSAPGQYTVSIYKDGDKYVVAYGKSCHNEPNLATAYDVFNRCCRHALECAGEYDDYDD